MKIEIIKFLSKDIMEKLKAIEIAEIGKIQVNGITGTTIFDAAKECIYLAKLLKVVVDLHWNGKVISVYRTTNIEQVLEQITSAA